MQTGSFLAARRLVEFEEQLPQGRAPWTEAKFLCVVFWIRGERLADERCQRPRRLQELLTRVARVVDGEEDKSDLFERFYSSAAEPDDLIRDARARVESLIPAGVGFMRQRSHC